MAWDSTGCFDSRVGEYTEPLAELRHHWGSAYVIEQLGKDLYLAQRRDDRAVLRAESPGELLEKIRDDYAVHPVSRRIAGADRPQPLDCRFRPEG
jgi:hypothetical protein